MASGDATRARDSARGRSRPAERPPDLASFSEIAATYRDFKELADSHTKFRDWPTIDDEEDR